MSKKVLLKRRGAVPGPRKKMRERLLKWDPSLTKRELMQKLGVSYSAINGMVSIYKLKYKSGFSKFKEREMRIRSIWNPNLSIRENAVALGMSRSAANIARLKYGLKSYLYKEGRLEYNARKEVINFLRGRGFNLEEIGKLYGVTRQRIHQIELNDPKGGIR